MSDDEHDAPTAESSRPWRRRRQTGQHDGGQGGDQQTKQKPKRSFWRELPILIVVALALSFVIQNFVARVYVIPSQSMEPTLHGCVDCTNDRVLVDKITYRFHEPRQGDVIVFRGPESWDNDFTSNRSSNVVVRGLQQFGSLVGLAPPDERDFIKRVIATGGQTVECCDAEGRVLVDGKPLTEPYVVNDFEFVPGVLDCTTPVQSARCFEPVTVPEGNLWVMGDNRSDSADSRYHVADDARGTVPVDNVLGKAWLIVSPLSRWQVIDSPTITSTAQASAMAQASVTAPQPADDQDTGPLGALGVGALAVLPVAGLRLGAARRDSERQGSARQR